MNAEANRNPGERSPVDDRWPRPVLPGSEAPPPLPVEVLPAPLQAFVIEAAEATQTPTDLGTMMSLAAVSSLAQSRMSIHVREGWIEPANIYTIGLAESGSRKSALVNLYSRPISAMEVEQAEAMQDDIATAVIKKSAANAKAELLRQHYSQQLASETGDEEAVTIETIRRAEREAAEIVVPWPPSSLLDDFTVETVPYVMERNAGCAAVLSAEGESLFAGRRYSGGEDPRINTILKAHASEDLRITRKSRNARSASPIEQLVIPEARLTMGLLVQPTAWARFRNTFGVNGLGFIERFLVVAPAGLVGQRRVRPKPIRDTTTADFANLLREIAGATQDRRIALVSGTADRMLEAFQAELEPQLGPGGSLHEVASWGSKLAGATARIAGLFHAAETRLRGGNTISVDSMASAIEIGRGLVPHFMTAVASGPEGHGGTVAERRIGSWLVRRAREGVLRVEATELRNLRGLEGKLSAATRDEALDVLSKRHFCRRSERWLYINPRLAETLEKTLISL